MEQLEKLDRPIDTSSSNSGTESSQKDSLEDDVSKGLFGNKVSLMCGLVIILRKGQEILTTQLDSLDQELLNMKEKCHDLPDLAIYTQMMINSKKRIHNAKTLLSNTYNTLMSLQNNILKEASKKKTLLEP